MAKDWYLIGNSPIYNSGFENDEFQQYKDSGLDDVLNSPISSSVQIVDNDLNVVSDIRAVVQNNLADTPSSTLQRRIMTKIGTLNSQDYIKYDNKIYLINSIVGNNQWYEKAIMQYCNFTLKFQSSDGIIRSYPCIVDNRVQGTGDTDTKTMTLPSGRKIILIPYNEHTILLRNDKRLFVDIHPTHPMPYKIDFVDSTKFNYGDKGLLEIYVSEDALRENIDRPDLGVCDYFDPSEEVESPVEGYSYATITCSGDLIAGGVTRTIIPTFYEADSTINNTIIPVWDIVLPLGYEDQFVITYADNQVKIKVAENYDLIEKTITFNVMGSNGGYGGSLTLMITV